MRLRAEPAGPLTGTTAVPGDKSLSHRALLLAAMAIGESRIEGLLEGADVRATDRRSSSDDPRGRRSIWMAEIGSSPA